MIQFSGFFTWLISPMVQHSSAVVRLADLFKYLNNVSHVTSLSKSFKLYILQLIAITHMKFCFVALEWLFVTFCLDSSSLIRHWGLNLNDLPIHVYRLKTFRTLFFLYL